MRRMPSRTRPKWRAAFRLAFQCIALALTLLVARAPASLPIPPPDVDHVAPVTGEHSGHATTRHRVSSRTVQSPLAKRLTATPAYAWYPGFEQRFTVAGAEFRTVDIESLVPQRLQRRIPRMDSDEPPRG